MRQANDSPLHTFMAICITYAGIYPSTPLVCLDNGKQRFRGINMTDDRGVL